MKLKQPSELARTARRKIDADIDKLERRIQSLKTKRNELSPISVLPPEILSKIFIFARDGSIEIQFYYHQVQWIIVGHVCHYWRQVALGCPSLWSVPVFTKPDLAQEMLRRSKTAALTIGSVTSGWTLGMLKNLENALTQIHRIQSIDLRLSEKVKTTVFSSLSQPAPLLENISLCDITDDQPSFPLDALSDAPRLRSVRFVCLSFSWESAVFRHENLTELRLNDSFDDASTIGQMMDALRCLPNLRILELTNSIPSHLTSNRNGKALKFKFLEHLELHDEAVDCIFLLRHIQYPPCATVRLHSLSATVEDSITIFSLIGQNLRRPQSDGARTSRSPVIIRSAQLTSSNKLGDPVINFFNKVDDMKHPFAPSNTFNPIVSIYFGGGYTLSQARCRLIMSLYNCFDLSSLQGLLLDWSFTFIEIRAIQDTFGKLPKLKIINITGFFLDMCLAIAESPDDSPAKGPEETQARYPSRRKKLQHYFPPVTIFPALRALVIENVDFRQHRDPENMEFLVDMLIKRSDMNAPIDRLSLQQCRGVRTWQQRLLGELVVDLEVEGEVIDVRELNSDDDGDSEDDYSDEGEDESDHSDSDYPYWPPSLSDSHF